MTTSHRTHGLRGSRHDSRLNDTKTRKEGTDRTDKPYEGTRGHPVGPVNPSPSPCCCSCRLFVGRTVRVRMILAVRSRWRTCLERTMCTAERSVDNPNTLRRRSTSVTIQLVSRRTHSHCSSCFCRSWIVSPHTLGTYSHVAIATQVDCRQQRCCLQ